MGRIEDSTVRSRSSRDGCGRRERDQFRSGDAIACKRPEVWEIVHRSAVHEDWSSSVLTSGENIGRGPRGVPKGTSEMWAQPVATLPLTC